MQRLQELGLFCLILLLPVSLIARTMASNLALATLILSVPYATLLIQRQGLTQSISKLMPLFILITLNIVLFWTSSVPMKSLSTAFKILMIILMGWACYIALQESALKIIKQNLGIGMALAIIVFAFEILTNGALVGLIPTESHAQDLAHLGHKYYSRGITVFILALWPFLALTGDRKKVFAPTVIISLGIFLLYYNAHVVVAGFFASLLAFTLCLWRPRFTIKLMAVGSAFVLLASPFVWTSFHPNEMIQFAGPTLLKKSYHHRIYIAHKTATESLEKPIFGHGLGSFRSNFVAQGIDDIELIDRIHNLNPADIDQQDMNILTNVVHPHNFSLHVWYDMGAIGAILCAIFIFNALWSISRWQASRYQLSCFAGFIAAIFVMGHIDYSAWHTWWLASIVLFTVLMLRALLSYSTFPHLQKSQNFGKIA